MVPASSGAPGCLLSCLVPTNWLSAGPSSRDSQPLLGHRVQDPESVLPGHQRWALAERPQLPAPDHPPQALAPQFPGESERRGPRSLEAQEELCKWAQGSSLETESAEGPCSPQPLPLVPCSLGGRGQAAAPHAPNLLLQGAGLIFRQPHPGRPAGTPTPREVEAEWHLSSPPGGRHLPSYLLA